MELLGIDVGGTELKYAVAKGTALSDQGKMPTLPRDAAYEDFLSLIGDLYESVKASVEGIAISLPCYVDVEAGKTDGGVLPYLWHKDLQRDLEERCGCPVALENDGKAAAIAELEVGALQGCGNAAVFLLGTGVGGGLILNGQVYHGRHFTAGEFGLMNVDIQRYTERRSSLRSYCSTLALLEQYRKESGADERVDGITFFERLPHDEAAQNALCWFARNIGIQIFNLGVLLDLEKVAIGGGISRQERVMQAIHEQYAAVRAENHMAKAGRTLPGNPEIVVCQYGNDANIIGACFNYASIKNRRS